MKATSTPKKSTAEKETTALLEKENKQLSSFQNLLLQTPVAIAIFRGSKYIVELANNKALEVIVKDSSFIGKPLFDAMPELENPIKEIFDKIMQTGIPFQADEMELPLFRNSKTKAGWFNVNYQPIRDDDNTISGIIASANEVTEQVLARKKVEESEKRYNMLLMKSPFGFAVFKGKNMVITLANDSIKEMWGKGKDVVGKPLFDIIPEFKDSAFPGLLDKVYTTGIPYYGDELLAPVFRNGKLEDVYFNFVYQPYLEADETISGVTVIAYEVTASVIVKKALEAQQAAEQKALILVEETNKRYYSMLMESPFAFSVMKGKNMVITLANDLIKEFWGKGKDVEGKALLQLLPELIDQPFPEMIEKVYTTGIPVYANELLGKVTYNGQLKHKYFNVVFQAYYEADNSISGVTQIAYEVTEMVMARKKIEESEARFKSIVMQTPVAIGIYKGKEYIAEIANEHCLQMLNKGMDFVGKPLFHILPELETQGFKGLMDNVMESGTTFYGNELAFNIHKNNISTQGFYNFIIKQLRADDESVTGIVVVASEVTEQVLARQKVEESELRFRKLIYTSPSAIGILLGEDLVITTANEPIIEIWGKGKEIMGKKYFEALPELAEQGYKEVFNQVYKTGIPFNAIETPVSILQNGVTTLKYYNFILYPQKNINGEINGIGIIATEVTSQAKYNIQIKASEERFRLLVMQAPVAICVLRGEDFIFETMNQEMANFLDRKIEDSLNKPLFDVLTEVKDQVYKELLDTVYSTGNRYVSQELPLVINRNGKLEDVFVKFVYEPLREADGTVSGVMVLADEITDQVNARKAVEVSEKKFRLLTNNMPQKITNADAEGNVIFFNQQWIDDTGLTFDELVNYGWVEAMHPDDLELTVNNWKHSVATGEIFDMECRIKNKEGGYRWNLSRAVPIKDETGKIIMWVGSNTDIQEQKEQNEKLQHAVAVRTLELSEANEELIKMNKELEAFTYVSSHDLQEPLRKIRTMAGRILENEEQNLSDTGKNHFRRMQNAAERMQTLIQDLLAFSHLSMADRKFETTNLNIIIEEVKREFQEAMAEKNAVIEVSEICEAKIIPFQFRQIIHNLIGNALKFSNPTIPPHIIVKSHIIQYNKINAANLPPQTAYCHISVSDNGIGFKKEYAEKIFEVFQKLHSKDEYAGTGIGLAIVKKIVDNHNGVITATSELNKGTTFNIYIPA
ncbi:PAS domain S-box protein [Parasediminibacterium sp. JCM 36343]|uniref:PAS domain-containing sensor histidine kinase n=1 Tax=Parasediminibacterium sp. JCM 36343 TaxID=3374279 RepID=UPI0039787BB5